MPQGIRRTNLMQARTEDPFEALLRTDAQRMAREQQSEQSLLAREAKEGMFDREMEMKGSQFDRKFAETQMQNAASRANAAARLGLARQAAARAGKGSEKLSWMQKELFKEKMYERGKGIRYKDYSKDTDSNGKGSGKSAITPYQRETLHSDDVRILEERDANMRADNVSYNDRAASIASGVEDTAFLNFFNYNKNALKSETF